MSTDVVTIEPEATLRHVAALLSDRHISGAPVVTSAGRLVGVISATDVLDFVASTPGVPVERPEFSEWGERTEGRETARDEEEPPSTFLDFWADVGADVVERFRETTGPEWDVLEEHTADEVMTRQLMTLPPDADAGEAGRMMRERGIHRVLIVDGDRLAGVVTAHDLLPLLESEAAPPAR